MSISAFFAYITSSLYCQYLLMPLSFETSIESAYKHAVTNSELQVGKCPLAEDVLTLALHFNIGERACTCFEFNFAVSCTWNQSPFVACYTRYDSEGN